MMMVVKKSAPALLVLLLLPLALLMGGGRWSPGPPGGDGPYWFAVTQSVSQPWGILSAALLGGVMVRLLALRGRAALRLFLLLMLCVGSAQSINAGIKCAIQAPRPYVLHLTAAAGVAPADFYARSAAERREWVRRHVASQPGWLGDHWARETGFAFPSGHGLFVATWVTLAAMVLPRRRYAVMVPLLAWAAAVMYSRFALGMHWPRDLLAAALLGWLWALPFGWYIRRRGLDGEADWVK
ncbi:MULTISPECIES: phosphatase PAP2 family protein [Edwardsiella]|uniref:undecaprenyl-diphosphate phosphatase n=2 Tax=Edwardsiella anguillarum TaxID=1821960 RepID=A0A076LI22_9GAMM|nr:MULTISPECIES: phosphatase PAP2 family protein [Edwardsiella]AIJ06562.1 Phosphatidylglycerophosphatase B [Edwardsiella anguillarum ET080813]AKR78104.2 phosphatase PAP2 family protein [Edwardsiella sp. LADL05-105]KAB0593211.1 phosphatase PAP2 family protein [Edwardsiella anguillarum]UOU77773.1 phosphatase PAP2 family protein [Edwardsiella anguillarum]WHP82487.1 phosphatase PAP2 family protein [Edwardsiella anguillarum]